MDWKTIILLILIFIGVPGIIEWYIINVYTPIGSIVGVLNWTTTLNGATPFTLLLGVLMIVLPVYIGKVIIEIIKDKIGF